MDPVSAVAIYFIIWWLTLLVVLTFGDRRADPVGQRAPGIMPGAPARSRMGRRVAITTVVSLFLFAGLYTLLNSGLTLDDIPFPRPPEVPEYEAA